MSINCGRIEKSELRTLILLAEDHDFPYQDLLNQLDLLIRGNYDAIAATEGVAWEIENPPEGCNCCEVPPLTKSEEEAIMNFPILLEACNEMTKGDKEHARVLLSTVGIYL